MRPKHTKGRAAKSARAIRRPQPPPVEASTNATADPNLPASFQAAELAFLRDRWEARCMLTPEALSECPLPEVLLYAAAAPDGDPVESLVRTCAAEISGWLAMWCASAAKPGPTATIEIAIPQMESLERRLFVALEIHRRMKGGRHA